MKLEAPIQSPSHVSWRSVALVGDTNRTNKTVMPQTSKSGRGVATVSTVFNIYIICLKFAYNYYRDNRDILWAKPTCCLHGLFNANDICILNESLTYSHPYWVEWSHVYAQTSSVFLYQLLSRVKWQYTCTQPKLTTQIRTTVCKCTVCSSLH